MAPTTEPPVRTWKLDRFWWCVFRVGIPSVTLALSIIAVATAPSAKTVGDGLLAIGICVPLFLSVGACCFLMGRAQLDLYREHLVLRTTFRTHDLRLSDVAQVKGAANGYRFLALKTTSGRVICSRAVSGMQPWYRDPKFEEQLAEVRGAIDALRGTPTSPAEPVGRH